MYYSLPIWIQSWNTRHIQNQYIGFVRLLVLRRLLFNSPFNRDSFDFGDPTFWKGNGKMAAFFANDAQLRTLNAYRGSKRFLYMNRTFF